jgi:Coenzyme PQQ synthesis protein D (PqqD)
VLREKGSYIGFSEVGARIWELIETPQQVDTACIQLQKQYEVKASFKAVCLRRPWPHA